MLRHGRIVLAYPWQGAAGGMRGKGADTRLPLPVSILKSIAYLVIIESETRLSTVNNDHKETRE